MTMAASLPPRSAFGIRFALLLLMLFGGIAVARAQQIDPATAGRLYVFAFPDTTADLDLKGASAQRNPKQDTFAVAIYSATRNSVTITGNFGYSKVVTIAAGTTEVIYLNGNPRAATPIATESGTISTKTFRLEAEQPVVLYCFMITKFGTEAFTPIPVERWGTTYFTAAIPGEVLLDMVGQTWVPSAAPAEILVIAAYDRTAVTITPNARLDKNAPTTVVLNKGECYQVQSYVDTSSVNLGTPQPDLGGSRITANKPIGMISGNTRAQGIDMMSGRVNEAKGMMIEWIAPADEHGTEFVYLPTWDSQRPTGAPGENPSEKRRMETVRVYGTSTDTGSVPVEGSVIEGYTGTIYKTFQTTTTKFFELQVDSPTPQIIEARKPVQAFMSSTGVVRLISEGTGISTYDAWAPYMVELTPREQWPSAAPYYVPKSLGTSEHFLNIVTDAASRNRITINGKGISFNRQIVGSQLYWTTLTLTAGEMGVIAGADTDARFYAFVYGGTAGFQDIRSGVYAQSIGHMYGYPLAPRRRVLLPADSLKIDSTYDCSELTVKVRALNANPAGLLSITLDSAVNAYIRYIDPAPPDPVSGRSRAEVVVVPIGAYDSASGVVHIQDRTGRSWTVDYRWGGNALKPVSQLVDFGDVPVNVKQTKTVAVVNRSAAAIPIDSLWLAFGGVGFSVLSTKPAVSHDPNNRTMLKSGDTLVVTIELVPTIGNNAYVDSLTVTSGCTLLGVLLRAQTVQPCLHVDDLDFGVLASGQQKSLPLEICNKGTGEVTFTDPWLTWLRTEFSVSQADIDKLKTVVLTANDCVSITVTFKAGGKGSIHEVAQLWANTRTCRDTSVWTAVVTQPGPQITGYDWGLVQVTRGNSCTKSTIENYKQDLLLTNDGDRPLTVAKIELLGPDADLGFFKLDSSAIGTTVNVGDVINPGDAGRTQRVVFTPTEEREYSCIASVTTGGATPLTSENTLRAFAMDAHVTVNNHDFGLYQFVAPNNPTMNGRTTIVARGYFPMRLTSVRVNDGLDFSITGISKSDGSSAAFPITLSRGEMLNVDVAFHPQTADPMVKTAELVVEGTFAHCDDSTGLLRAGVTPAGVAVTGDDRAGALAIRIEPNPVRSEAAIALLLPARAHTTAEIFNAAGVRMATLVDGTLDAGEQVLRWNTAGAPSGLYYCRITSGVRSLVRPIVVMR